MNFIDVLVILGVFTLLGSVKIHETKCKCLTNAIFHNGTFVWTIVFAREHLFFVEKQNASFDIFLKIRWVEGLPI